MQTGNVNQRRTTEYVSYQRARRTDAEPIINEFITYGCRFFSFWITASTMRFLTDLQQIKTVACRQGYARTEQRRF